MEPPDARRSQLEQDVQQTILTDLVGITVPLISALMVLVGVVVTVAGQPRRLIPTGIYFVMVLFAAWWSRQGKTLLAARTLAVGGIATAGLGLWLNGALRAPAMLMMTAALALAGWLLGRRGFTWLTAIASLYVVAIATLSELQLLPEAPPPAVFANAIIGIAAFWLIWAATSRPQLRMRAALRDSLQREQARLDAERQRQQTELAFQAVFDQSGHLMLLLEPEGRLSRANGIAHARLPGLVAGRPLVDLLPWPKPELAKLASALEGTRTSGTPAQLVAHDGQGRSLDLTLAPFRDQAGSLRYLILQGRDITELLDEKEREARSHRLALVGQLAGGVAHDFNNVLAVTLSSAEELRDELEAAGQLTPTAKESLDDISSVTQRAADLTRRLLAFGRRAPMQRRVRSMHELLGSTVKLLQRTLPASIAVHQRLDARDDLVEADDASVESVLLNLAINARDAMPRGGTLTLATERVELDEAWCRASGFELTPGPFLRVMVTDTGTGIAPEIVGRIFEPFFTTKAEGKGSGIGLASVMGSMQEHRGAVRVSSVLGQGTTFELFFPLASGEVIARGARAAASILAGLAALVVDDEPALRALLGRVLGRLGVEVVVCPTAEEGLAEFDKDPARFDFAVLDVVLPGRSGVALAADLIARSQIRVLLVSGFPRDADLATLPAGRVALLGKPFNVEGLRGALSALLTGVREG